MFNSSAPTIFASILAFVISTPVSADLSEQERSATALLAELVSFPTVQGQGQVPVLAGRIQQHLIEGGFAPADVIVTQMEGSATLVARYRGRDSSRPILISNHMDVVEAKREDWTRDPFTLVTENGYHFGRGVYDNKLDVALTVSTLLRLKREGFVPAHDIVLVLSGDEETEMKTTAALSKQFPGAALVLNGDGGGGTMAGDERAVVYSIQTAEKTYATFEIEVTNPGGHSSRPRKDNAIYQLADALKRLEAYAFPVQSTEQTRAAFAFTGQQIGGSLGQAMQRFARNPSDLDAVAEIAADPEYVGTLRTTCVATQLHAGHAENALPQRAAATVNCRIFPGTSIEQVRASIAQQVRLPETSVREIGKGFASDASPLSAEVMTAVRKAVDANFPGLPVIPTMSSGATDSLYFRAEGIPSYGVSGAYVDPKDDFSHGLDERVPVSTLARGLKHWYVLLTELAK